MTPFLGKLHNGSGVKVSVSFLSKDGALGGVEARGRLLAPQMDSAALGVSSARPTGPLPWLRHRSFHRWRPPLADITAQ